MNQLSSSTSNSDRSSRSWRRGLKLTGWAAAFLVLFDIGVNLLFAYPQDPQNLNPNRLQLYFDYGRSMEGRLRRATRRDPAQTAPITLAGWYEPITAVQRADKPGGKTITLYGNSQTVRLAEALQKVSPRYSARTVAGPGSTANWGYGAFLRDKNASASEAVVLTIMPSNLPMITTMSAMTWNMSFAMPYTADGFSLSGGRLVRHVPPYESFEEYVQTLEDEDSWQAALEVFRRHDPFYDSFLLEQTPLDHSTLVRLARRGWAQRRDGKVRAQSLRRGGQLQNEDESIRIANAIIAAFAKDAREAGLLPVIYIVNSRGYGDQMYRVLEKTLRKNKIPHLSTHFLLDPNDPRNYLPDNHFTDANDLVLARAMARLLENNLDHDPL